MRTIIVTFISSILIFFGTLSAEVTEMRLSNGMRVILKQIPGWDEDVEVRLIAPGGWSGFNKAEKVNARIATDVLWESGFGNLTSDQLYAQMWLHSVELSSDIGPFCRTIDGSATDEGVETLFKLIHLMFTSPTFTESGLAESRQKIADTLRVQPYDTNYTFDYCAKALNSAHYKGFRQLSINSLKRKTHIDLLKSVYDKCFGDPSSFTVFISGHFDKEGMGSLLNKYFGSIPVKGKNSIEMTTVENGNPIFPKGIARLEVPIPQIGFSEALIRMTFPINTKVDRNNFKNVYLLAKLIDRRLNKKFEKTGIIGEGYCFCNYSFPFYPYLNEAWITIQSRSGASGTFKDPLQVEEAILADLRDLKAKGPTADELAYLNVLVKDKDGGEDLLKLFLIEGSTISIDEMLPTQIPEKIVSDGIKKIVSELIDLDRYTVIFSKK